MGFVWEACWLVTAEGAVGMADDTVVVGVADTAVAAVTVDQHGYEDYTCSDLKSSVAEVGIERIARIAGIEVVAGTEVAAVVVEVEMKKMVRDPLLLRPLRERKFRVVDYLHDWEQSVSDSSSHVHVVDNRQVSTANVVSINKPITDQGMLYSVCATDMGGSIAHKHIKVTRGPLRSRRNQGSHTVSAYAYIPPSTM